MPIPSPRAWLQAHRTGLRRAGWTLLGLYLLYLFAANLFLNGAIGERVANRKPDRYHARWDWALSAYPGHIHASGVVMGGHARTNRWAVAATRADGRIRVLPLLWRTVSFGTIRAHDVSVHVSRVAEDKLPSKREGRGWTLDFPAITTPSLLRLDFYQARVSGRGDARFVFTKQLQGGPMAVGASTLRMPEATLSVAGVELLRGGRLEFGLAIPAHIRERAQGREKFGILDAYLRAEGAAPAIDLSARHGEALPLGAPGQAGHLRADLALSRGVLRPGSRLDWSAPVHALDAEGRPVRYPLGAALRTRREAIELALRMPRTRPGAPWLQADLRVDDRRLGPDDWLRPVRALNGRLRTHWPQLPLRWIDTLLDDLAWLEVDGRGDLDADIVLADGQPRPGSRMDLDRLELAARVLDNRFAGQAQARVRVLEQAGAPRTEADIRLRHFALGPEARPGQVDLRGRDLRLELVSAGPLAEFQQHLRARLRFEDAEVPDLRSYNRYLPGASARLLGGSGLASGDLHLDREGGMVDGHMRLRGRDVRLALGPSRLSGNVELDSRLRRLQVGERRYAVEALSVGLDGVRLEQERGGQAPWWARMRLEQGELHWREPFEVNGRGTVEMRDASVLLGLFAERKAFPRWIGNLVDSGRAQASGRLRIRDQELVFDHVHASNDRIGLQARLRIAGGQPDGDLYARWGVLGMGVELQPGQRRLHLAGAREWYESRPALLPE
ncbi:hypothetical protein EIM50_10550 [Pseudoxanthomonas sp. SGD-10]|nr:hypothetical protein EIM50_10550 [Pseudoxanthomonas sp. SGD-10]